MTATLPTASDLSAALASRVDDVVPTLLPNARRAGGYWIVGGTSGEMGKSLYVHRNGPRAGKWDDAATGEHGDLLDLAGAVLGTDLKGALAWARSHLGIEPGSLKRSKPTPTPRPDHRQRVEQDDDDRRRIAMALEMWKSAKPATGSLVQVYLQTRGIIIPIPPTIRYAPALRHGPTGLDLPAMVCAVQAPDRRITAIHRTFLGADGRTKAPVSPDKMTLGCCAGAAIRLGPAGPKIAVAEGIETGLSVAQSCSGLSVWGGLGTSGMRSIILPAQVREVLLCPDADEPGEKAAQAAAERFTAEGRAVSIARPPDGQDFNDRLQERVA